MYMDPFYIGQIMPWPLSWAPAGWLFCAGQVLASNQYQELSYVIGNIYGGNPNAGTFALPNLQQIEQIGQIPYTTNNRGIRCVFSP